MKKSLFYVKLFTLAIIFSFLTACASTTNPSFGPIKQDDAQVIISESISSEEEVIFYSRALWFENKNGFKFLPAGKGSRKGVFFCTDQAIYFSEWKSKQYIPVFTAKYSDIGEFRLAANELFGRLVVKSNKYNSFELMGVDGPDLPNKEETEVAFKIIENQK